MPMRYTIVILLIIILALHELGILRFPSSVEPLSSEDSVLNHIIPLALEGLDNDFKTLTWSGGSGPKKFDKKHSFFVEGESLDGLSDRFYQQIDIFRQSTQLRSGFGRGNHGLVDFNYQRDGVQYYFDFCFIPTDHGITVVILHKGVACR